MCQFGKPFSSGSEIIFENVNKQAFTLLVGVISQSWANKMLAGKFKLRCYALFHPPPCETPEIASNCLVALLHQFSRKEIILKEYC